MDSSSTWVSALTAASGTTSACQDPRSLWMWLRTTVTLTPEQAAKACELLGVKQVVPMHYGTFPALTGTPVRLRELVEPKGVQVLELTPGETAT